ncbi:hypothetical protein DPX39_100036900 [Trypanosoma brucei equiperdum]|uniref:Transmembrane protein n=1 Tax=Trypanosoma brucei equiperdum TaxID=630700 RepID=A0A3L6KZS5_9TRYP|nr:hypothetical protein DPX39_100036900 [Trypanosoma brucei equiperdum]
MFSRSFVGRMGNGTYGGWPWPVKLPLKRGWHHELDRHQSITEESRRYILFGDALLVSIVLYSVYRLYYLALCSDAYRTHLSHLSGAPPAIIANSFDFANLENNRTVPRAVLDEYREAVVDGKVKRAPIESIIFKY